MSRYRANAKINLWLRVEGRRADGFHDIETVFRSVGLADELAFDVLPEEIDVVMSYQGAGREDIPLGDNLVYCAATALRDHAGTRYGARIEVTKHIPSGAGLAGGSADAAAAFVALNEAWSTGLKEDRLMRLAADNGSDTPFCVRGGVAVGRGRGEDLAFIEGLPELSLVIATSHGSLSTRDVYERCSPGPPDPAGADQMVAALERGNPEEIAGLLRNDLEPAAFALRPELRGHKAEVLDAGALGALVSGSGPTLFGLCRDDDHATTVAGRCRDSGKFAGVVSTRTRPSCVERID
jgi:4-diphosphocytidyl-2-C-methyl-D-erythritol kinase